VGQSILRNQPNTHDVHEWVVRVRRIEKKLATHGGNADAIAVGTYAAHNSADQAPCRGVIRPAELERVEQGDGACAHSHDVAQDPTHTRRSTLERLDRAGMVVRLQLERDRQSIADADHTGVLARACQYVITRRWKVFQQRA
jgi:hypothetical protein